MRPSRSTHPAVTATVSLALAASSVVRVSSHCAAVISAYGAQRLIGGTYFRKSRLPGNGSATGPSGMRVIPYTSCCFDAAPTSSILSAMASPLIEHLLVDALDLGGGPLPPEQPIHTRAIGRAELQSQSLVAQEIQYGPRETGGISWLAEKSAVAGYYHLWQRASVGHDHRTLTSHRFGHGEPKTLERRRRHEDVGQVVVVHFLHLAHVAGEVHTARRRNTVRLGAEGFELRTDPGDHELRVRPLRCDKAPRVEEDGEVLPSLEAAKEKEHRLAREPEVLDEPLGLRSCRELRIHAVVDHDDPVLRH